MMYTVAVPIANGPELEILYTNDVPDNGVVIELETELTGRHISIYDSVLNAQFPMIIGSEGAVLFHVHGNRKGELYVDTADGSSRIVSPQQLRDVLKRAGINRKLIVSPCYPKAARERWQHEIDRKDVYVIGDYDSRSITCARGSFSHCTLRVYESAY